MVVVEVVAPARVQSWLRLVDIHTRACTHTKYLALLFCDFVARVTLRLQVLSMATMEAVVQLILGGHALLELMVWTMVEVLQTLLCDFGTGLMVTMLLLARSMATMEAVV